MDIGNSTHIYSETDRHRIAFYQNKASRLSYDSDWCALQSSYKEYWTARSNSYDLKTSSLVTK